MSPADPRRYPQPRRKAGHPNRPRAALDTTLKTRGRRTRNLPGQPPGSPPSNGPHPTLGMGPQGASKQIGSGGSHSGSSGVRTTGRLRGTNDMTGCDGSCGCDGSFERSEAPQGEPEHNNPKQTTQRQHQTPCRTRYARLPCAPPYGRLATNNTNNHPKPKPPKNWSRPITVCGGGVPLGGVWRVDW